ncbi:MULTISPECIES: hypothetical protein [unclassified Spirosoma]|uniref:hypothetical protein n=1 Tax=unclassified Spirosoma TaxID=2621999 RepID=UPI00096419F2|nr:MULTISPECIES: hypothetical protein [unclassified Spirosoma]MBN8822282.1 hypothetical protein [Spirosoma sp.]OJW72412.1 MAG: hypothetical protein BGO59_14850 [Spirosoma sp. 48-14]
MNTRKHLCLTIIGLFFLAASFGAQAQSLNTFTTPQDGFWVIETTPKSSVSIVRFYTNDQRLIYQETISRKLNIRRVQTKKQLNVALEQALFVWNATHKVPTDRQWVAMQFDK